MNKIEVLQLLQHAEREVDVVISNLGNIKDKRLNLTIDRLFELSLEFNTRINHLKKEAQQPAGRDISK